MRAIKEKSEGENIYLIGRFSMMKFVWSFSLSLIYEHSITRIYLTRFNRTTSSDASPNLDLKRKNIKKFNLKDLFFLKKIVQLTNLQFKTLVFF